MIDSCNRLYKLLFHPKRIILILTVIILSSLFDVLGLYLIPKFIKILSGESEDISVYFINFNDHLILKFSLLLVAIYIVKLFLNLFSVLLISKYCMIQQVLMSEDLLRKISNKDYLNFILKTESEYIYLINKLTYQFAQGPLKLALSTLSNILIGVVIFTYLLYINLYVFLFFISFLMMGGYIYLLRNRSKSYSNGVDLNIAGAKVINYTKDLIINFKEIKIISASNYFIKRIKSEELNYGKNYSSAIMVSTAPKQLFEFIFLLCLIFSGILLSYTEKPENIVPVLSIFVLAIIRLLPIISSMLIFFMEISFHKDSIDKLYDYFQAVIDDINTKVFERQIFQDSISSIALKNLIFSYQGKKNIINDLSVELKRGEITAFVGASGNGKSTLLYILSGLIYPNSGQIIINGSFKLSSMSQISDRITYIGQEVNLLQDTVIRNIAFGVNDEHIDYDRVNLAIEKANLKNVISGLHKKLNAVVGVDYQPSGGEKQRFGIARAFYNDSEILILDEFTSSLDERNESEIFDELLRFSESKIIITVAHRKSAIERCHTVFEVRNGSVDKLK